MKNINDHVITATAILGLAINLVACSKAASPSPASATMAVPQQPATSAAVPASAPVQVLGNAVETEVPLEDDGGTFVVPVTINDTISLKFTLDSGAADVSVPSDVVSTLIRSGTITREDYIDDKTYVLADGSTVPSAEFRIKTLKVGTLVLHDVTGSLADSKGYLLLGQSFLSRLSNWSIDNSRHVLLLKAAPGQAELAASDQQSSLVAAAVQQPPEPSAATEAAGNVAVTPNQSMTPNKAASRALEYLAAWSNPRDPDGRGIQQYYAGTVKFYGRNTPKDDLMLQKLQFARRWPSRTYVARPNSLIAQCPDEHTCTVNGVVDWRDASIEANRASAGVATFVMEFRDGLIDYESGGVISRQGG